MRRIARGIRVRRGRAPRPSRALVRPACAAYFLRMEAAAAEGRRRVVIVGAGFAGLRVAWGLREADVALVLVDRQNHHLFQPLLYQVATAGLAAPDIAEPIRRALRRNENLRVVYGEVTEVDPEAKVVRLGADELPYDTLVLAAGATHSYFGRDEWSEVAPGLKTLQDAQNIRGRILTAFERAERENDEAARRPWLRFVVVGAGPTGVELSGAIAELAHRYLPRDFRRFDARTTEVFLLEGADRVLGSFTEELSEQAARQLRELGVEVRTGAFVTDIDAGGVTLDNGQRIEARTVVWAAGVQASPLVANLGAPLDGVGRVIVAPDLTVPGHPEVFVLGDAAHVKHGDRQVPGVAPAAIQMGAYAAEVIRHGGAKKPFVYRDKGSMATIGRAAAVAEIGKLKLTGFVAWMAWLVVHLLFLVGFRARLVVLINWIWAYLVYRPAARILPELARSEPAPESPATAAGAGTPAGTPPLAASPAETVRSD